MKRSQIITIIIASIAVIGVGAWYLVTDRQTVEKNNQQATVTDEPEAPQVEDSKFATLTGEAYDEAYIADMLAHHEGAINMAEMVGVTTDRQELIDLAQEIMQTQSQEVMKMYTWQEEWGYEKTSGGHGMHSSGSANDMAGDMMMMTDALMGLKGEEFDEKFLSLMIEHHQQAVDMSKYADTNASHQEIKDLAKAVITAQETEIAQMKQWQKEWGFEVSSDETPSSMPGMNH